MRWARETGAVAVSEESGGFGLGRSFAARLRGAVEQLAFGAGPIFEGVAGCATTFQIDLIGAQRDLFARGNGFRAGFARLGDGVFFVVGMMLSFQNKLLF